MAPATRAHSTLFGEAGLRTAPLAVFLVFSALWPISGQARTSLFDRTRLALLEDQTSRDALVLRETRAYELRYDRRRDGLKGTLRSETLVWIRTPLGGAQWEHVYVQTGPLYSLRRVRVEVEDVEGHRTGYDEGDLAWTRWTSSDGEIIVEDGETRRARVPGISAGDLVRVAIEYELRDLHGAPSVQWGDEPVLEREFSVRVRGDGELVYRLQGDRDRRGRVVHVVDEDGTHHWRLLEDIAEMENASPDDLRIVTHLVHPEGGLAAAPTWEQAGKAYLALIDERLRATDELETLARELASRAGPELDARIAAVNQYVQSHCHYLGLYSGRGGILPDFAEQVWHKGRSDCKGLGGLIITLLRAMDIDAWPVLLRVGDGQDIEAELPNLAQFDHFIVWIDDGTESGAYLDGTVKGFDLGELPAADCVPHALVLKPGAIRLQAIALPQRARGRRLCVLRGSIDSQRRLSLTLEVTTAGPPARHEARWQAQAPEDRIREGYLDRYVGGGVRLSHPLVQWSTLAPDTTLVRIEGESVAPLSGSKGRCFLPLGLVPARLPDREELRAMSVGESSSSADWEESWSLELSEGWGLAQVDSQAVDSSALSWSQSLRTVDGRLHLRRSIHWGDIPSDATAQDSLAHALEPLREASGRLLILSPAPLRASPGHSRKEDR